MTPKRRAINLSWFFKMYVGPLSCSSWNLERLVLIQENPSEQDENQIQIQPIHGIGPTESNLGGKSALSSLCHPFSLYLIHNHVNLVTNYSKTHLPHGSQVLNCPLHVIFFASFLMVNDWLFAQNQSLRY